MNTLDRLRIAIQQEDIRLTGRVNKTHKPILNKVTDEIRKEIAALNALFSLLPNGGTTTGLETVFVKAYTRLIKAHLRYRDKHDPSAKLTEADLQRFQAELWGLIELLSQHGIKVDEKCLIAAVSNGGLQYWQEFFNGEEYPPYREVPSAIKITMTRKPDPRLVLRERENRVQAILAEPEFAHLVERPSLVREAVFQHNDARPYLRQVQAKIQGLLSHPDFYLFSFWEIDRAVRTQKKPEDYLRAQLRKKERLPNPSCSDCGSSQTRLKRASRGHRLYFCHTCEGSFSQAA